MNNECKQFREIVENRNGSVIAHGGMNAPFEYRFNSSCLCPTTIIKLLLLLDVLDVHQLLIFL
jgi:hypothetical protein